VSIVLHAYVPWVPTIHMNIRYFEAADQQWFGGGIDLTPSYVDVDQARLFHTRLKAVCDRFDPGFYPAFKRWADDYFYLPHREETRGIGGIFYDRLAPSDKHALTHLFDFTCAVGHAFGPLYAEMAAPGRHKPFSEAEKAWQMLRRGRYVEFNLVHDRGTKFGLETGGRTESILMSLPPQAHWQYDHQPAPGSAEAFTLAHLRKGIDRLAT
jgi:coproporphyrinogen III oxidase